MHLLIDNPRGRAHGQLTNVFRTSPRQGPPQDARQNAQKNASVPPRSDGVQAQQQLHNENRPELVSDSGLRLIDPEQHQRISGRAHSSTSEPRKSFRKARSAGAIEVHNGIASGEYGKGSFDDKLKTRVQPRRPPVNLRQRNLLRTGQRCFQHIDDRQKPLRTQDNNQPTLLPARATNSRPIARQANSRDNVQYPGLVDEINFPALPSSSSVTSNSSHAQRNAHGKRRSSSLANKTESSQLLGDAEATPDYSQAIGHTHRQHSAPVNEAPRGVATSFNHAQSNEHGPHQHAGRPNRLNLALPLRPATAASSSPNVQKNHAQTNRARKNRGRVNYARKDHSRPNNAEVNRRGHGQNPVRANRTDLRATMAAQNGVYAQANRHGHRQDPARANEMFPLGLPHHVAASLLANNQSHLPPTVSVNRIYLPEPPHIATAARNTFNTLINNSAHPQYPLPFNGSYFPESLRFETTMSDNSQTPQGNNHYRQRVEQAQTINHPELLAAQSSLGHQPPPELIGNEILQHRDFPQAFLQMDLPPVHLGDAHHYPSRLNGYEHQQRQTRAQAFGHENLPPDESPYPHHLPPGLAENQNRQHQRLDRALNPQDFPHAVLRHNSDLHGPPGQHGSAARSGHGDQRRQRHIQALNHEELLAAELSQAHHPPTKRHGTAAWNEVENQQPQRHVQAFNHQELPPAEFPRVQKPSREGHRAHEDFLTTGWYHDHHPPQRWNEPTEWQRPAAWDEHGNHQRQMHVHTFDHEKLPPAELSHVHHLRHPPPGLNGPPEWRGPSEWYEPAGWNEHEGRQHQTHFQAFDRQESLPAALPRTDHWSSPWLNGPPEWPEPVALNENRNRQSQRHAQPLSPREPRPSELPHVYHPLPERQEPSVWNGIEGQQRQDHAQAVNDQELPSTQWPHDRQPSPAWNEHGYHSQPRQARTVTYPELPSTEVPHVRRPPPLWNGRDYGLLPLRPQRQALTLDSPEVRRAFENAPGGPNPDGIVPPSRFAGPLLLGADNIFSVRPTYQLPPQAAYDFASGVPRGSVPPVPEPEIPSFSEMYWGGNAPVGGSSLRASTRPPNTSPLLDADDVDTRDERQSHPRNRRPRGSNLISPTSHIRLSGEESCDERAERPSHQSLTPSSQVRPRLRWDPINGLQYPVYSENTSTQALRQGSSPTPAEAPDESLCNSYSSNLTDWRTSSAGSSAGSDVFVSPLQEGP